MSEPAVIGAVARDGGALRALRLLWPLLGALLVIRLALAATCNLLPDEAFYWIWTRHLASGYLDHPPMIAYLMWLSTRVFGDTQIGVRLPSVIMSLASVAMIVGLARRLLRDDRAAGFVAVIWLVSPLSAVMGLIFTPDTPSIFFSICALACAAMIAHQTDTDYDPTANLGNGHQVPLLWLMFGISCGLAMLSKYTSAVVPAGVTFAFLSSPSGRRHFRRPWVYISAVVALAVFSPVMYWNATHHWASFLFQLRHGTGEGITEGVEGSLRRLLLRIGGFGQFVGGQALVWTPVLFVVALVVLVVNWRKYFQLRDTDRVMLWCATLPLVLFGWASTRSRTEMNWPAFAYFPLSILIGGYLAEKWSPNRVHLVRIGCTVALAFSIVLHELALPGVPGLLMKLHIPMPHNVTDLYGWRDFGRQISDRAGGAPVICNRHQDAGEAEFYMPGQPTVWCEGVGSRPTAFDYFDGGRPDYAKIDRLLYVGSHEDEFMEKCHYAHCQRIPNVELPGPGRHRTRPMFIISR